MPDLVDRQDGAVLPEDDAIGADTKPQPLIAFQHLDRAAMACSVGGMVENPLFDPFPPDLVDLAKLPESNSGIDHIHPMDVAFR